VAVSGLEMAQNSGRIHWSRDEVDQKLKSIMENIYNTCRDTAADLGHPGTMFQVLVLSFVVGVYLNITVTKYYKYGFR